MLPQFVVDALVVGTMFFLRVGVPIALTLAFGYWLEKKLAPRDEETIKKTGRSRIIPFPQFPHEGTRRSQDAQPRCWEVKHCDPGVRADCPAFKRVELPCWLAHLAEGSKVREACFSCDLYAERQYRAMV